MDYDTAAIRHFITRFFDDDELNYLCADYFREVYEDFSTGMGKRQKVHNLVEYCYRHGRLPDLLAALERERPELYTEHIAKQPTLRVTSPVVDVLVDRNPRQVFISYAHEDAKFASQLAHELMLHGLPVWIAPISIRPGEKWVEAINRGLEESGVFVLVLTAAAVNSHWVRLETNAAIEMEREGEIRVIPLSVERSRVPPIRRVYQQISFRAKYETGLLALLSLLKADKSTLLPIRGVDSKPLSGHAMAVTEIKQSPNLSTSEIVVWPKDGKEMFRVPVGEFLYGKDKKTVYLPEFWIDKTPVTNAEYARFVAATGHRSPDHWKGQPKAHLDEIADHPVVHVSWDDVIAYTAWAGKRLPSEEEWEKAARGTDGREYPWGNEDPTDDLCNMSEKMGGTTPVGRYSPQGDSPYGCVDISGNVWEWTCSWYDDRKTARAVRGGSWSSHYRNANVLARAKHPLRLSGASVSLGFRLVSEVG